MILLAILLIPVAVLVGLLMNALLFATVDGILTPEEEELLDTGHVSIQRPIPHEKGGMIPIPPGVADAQ